MNRWRRRAVHEERGHDEADEPEERGQRRRHRGAAMRGREDGDRDPHEADDRQQDVEGPERPPGVAGPVPVEEQRCDEHGAERAGEPFLDPEPSEVHRPSLTPRSYLRFRGA